MLIINKSIEFSSNLNDEYNLNLNLVKRNNGNLVLVYENKYVAVKDENVINSDPVFQLLLRRIKFDYDGVWNLIAILPINRAQNLLMFTQSFLDRNPLILPRLTLING